MKANTLFPAALMASMIGLCAGAQAAPTIYFGENQRPQEIVTGDPLVARKAFEANLAGVSSEGFETQAVGADSLDLLFTGSAGNIGAKITGDGVIFQTPSIAGRFNTTGATEEATAGKWWYLIDDGDGEFKITFDSAVSAFGFYGTDIGDFNGQVTIDLLGDQGAGEEVLQSFTVNNTKNGLDGSLLFWGFIDRDVAYTSIVFGNTGAGVDGFGFDDMVIGDRRQVIDPPPPGTVPEPATLALVGLALLGAAASRRKRQA